MSQLKVRRSLLELQKEYEAGTKKPLEDLMRAWKGIKALPPDDLNSFFKIGGYHGEPFRGAGWGSSAYWGGYCNHGNVLFPTWHRVYLLRLEEALQSIEGCKDVMLPYWDETDEYSTTNGIPWPLTVENFTLDGVSIPNPLRSFVFPKNITDHISGDDPNYSKYKDYETVRYPLSGIVGNQKEIDVTNAHNALYSDYNTNVRILNNNVLDWLNSYIIVAGQKIETNVAKKFKDCLDAPNFTVFSNTTSAAEWNSDRQTIDHATGLPVNNDIYKVVVPLESPHNSIHLSIGGCEVPGYNRSPIPGANGDMGENDTAGLDPIFYFHHCNIDRMFWLWQKKHKATDKLEIIPEYPGTTTVDNQGPTPGFAPNSWLTLESPLNPFRIKKDGLERDYNSLDLINIEKQLGYTYSKGSLDEGDARMLLQEKKSYASRTIKISKINKAPINGSFMVSAFMNVNGEKLHLGTEAVLSRWNAKACANCQTHQEVRAFFELPLLDDKVTENLKAGVQSQSVVEVEIIGRDGLLNTSRTSKLLRSDAVPAAANFKLEII